MSLSYVADVVGVAFGLEELGKVSRQGVLLVDVLQTLLVEQLCKTKTG